MSDNGSGVFVVNSAGQPVVASTLITAVAFNALTADLATALSNRICADGQTTITQNIPLNNKKITGIAAATARTDGASIATIQDGTGVQVLLGSVGGTANAITLTPSPAITAYAQGQCFRFIAANTNTTATTVAISGLAAKAITKGAVVALDAGDIIIGYEMMIVYNGTSFGLLNPVGPRADNIFRICGSSDATKLVAFEADGITTATTRTVTIPDRNLTIGPALDTVQLTTSGTSKDFTGIPAGTKRITMSIVGLSTNGTATLIVQLGDAGGVENTGYDGVVTSVVNAGATSANAATAYFALTVALAAAGTYTGKIVLDLQNEAAFTWVASSVMARTDTATIFTGAGSKSLSAVLDRVRLTTTNGTDTFDAGSVNISYE